MIFAVDPPLIPHSEFFEKLQKQCRSRLRACRESLNIYQRQIHLQSSLAISLTMNPSPQDSSFSIHTQQQSKLFIKYRIMDAVVCWFGLIGLFWGKSMGLCRFSHRIWGVTYIFYRSVTFFFEISILKISAWAMYDCGALPHVFAPYGMKMLTKKILISIFGFSTKNCIR